MVDLALHQRWTQGDITALRQRVGAGETPEAIADSLHRLPDDVTAMMRRLRLRF